MKVLVLNGVNLGRLGQRQPEVYGSVTHAQLAEHLVATGAGLGLDVEVRQSDYEGEMVGWLHEAAAHEWPVVINPGAWSHYSYAIADAVVQVPTVLEVHISNVHSRESWRHTLVISPYVAGTIMGLGLGGYDLALAHLAALDSFDDPAGPRPDGGEADGGAAGAGAGAGGDGAGEDAVP